MLGYPSRFCGKHARGNYRGQKEKFESKLRVEKNNNYLAGAKSKTTWLRYEEYDEKHQLSA